MAIQKFKTKVEKLGVAVGTVVTFDDDEKKDNRGKTGKLLCAVPGGGLFYSEDELEPTE